MLIDLVRHGEPVGGRKYRGGGVDDPLSPLGWQQMRQAVAEPAPWTAVITSPMRRCAAFARDFAEARGLPLRVEPRLREMAFGVWEGRRPEDLLANEPEAYHAFFEDPQSGLPVGAEPLDRLLGRVGEVMAELTAGPASDHLLIFAHGGIIRAAVAWVTGMPSSHLFRLQLGYAQTTRFEVNERGRARLVYHARSCVTPVVS